MTNNIIIGDNLTASLVTQSIAIGKAAYAAQAYTQSNNTAKAVYSNVSNQLAALGSTAGLSTITQSIYTVVVNQSNLGLAYSSGKSSMTQSMINQVLQLIGAVPSQTQVYLLVGQICNLTAFAATVPDSVAGSAAGNLSSTLSVNQQSQLIASINQQIQSANPSSSPIGYANYLTAMTAAITNLQLGVTASQLQMIVQGLANLFGAVAASTASGGDWSPLNDGTGIPSNLLPQMTPHIVFMIQMVLALTGGLQGSLSAGAGGFSQYSTTQNVQNVVAAASSGGMNMPLIIGIVVVAVVALGAFWYFTKSAS